MALCEECNQENTGTEWCKACNAKHFQQNFETWTSGNIGIDKFIQDTQLAAKTHYKVIEWIPYDRFYNIEYIASGGFRKVYRANWIDSFICKWDNKNQETKNYMMVLDYAENGSLRNYLDTNYNELDWNTKFNVLWCIVNGLHK